MTVYGIYKAWFDSMENEPSSAFGYKLEAVTFDEEVAKNVCKEAGIIKKKLTWLDAPVGKPHKYYEELKVV